MESYTDITTNIPNLFLDSRNVSSDVSVTFDGYWRVYEDCYNKIHVRWRLSKNITDTPSRPVIRS